VHDFARVNWIFNWIFVVDKHVVFSQVLFNELNFAFISSRESEIVQGLVVDWEVTHGSSVFWSHVRDGGSVSKREVLASWSKEFNELSYDTSLSEHLHASKDEISGSSVLWELSSKSESNDLWQDHRNGLAEHDRLSFNTSNTPTGNSESVNHSSVGISSNNRVWVKKSVLVEHYSGKVLKVDLMDNTTSWWDNFEVVKSLGSPLQEFESFVVSLELKLFVSLSSSITSKSIDLNGVINNQIDWAERVNLSWVSSESLHGVSHGSQVNNGWHTCEILQEHSGGLEGNVYVLLGGVGPVQNLVNVGFFDGELVAVSDSALKEHSDGVRQPIDSLVLEGRQLVVVVGLGVVVEGGLNTIEWIFLRS